MSKTIEELTELLEKDPHGDAGDTAVALFNAWAECLNNILLHNDLVMRDSSHHLRDLIVKEALEWGFEEDNAGLIKTGIPG